MRAIAMPGVEQIFLSYFFPFSCSEPRKIRRALKRYTAPVSAGRLILQAYLLVKTRSFSRSYCLRGSCLLYKSFKSFALFLQYLIALLPVPDCNEYDAAIAWRILALWF